jgi:hypothetical protein
MAHKSKIWLQTASTLQKMITISSAILVTDLLTNQPKELILTMRSVSAMKEQMFKERRAEDIGTAPSMRKCTKFLMTNLDAVQINLEFHLISMTRKSKNNFMSAQFNGQLAMTSSDRTIKKMWPLFLYSKALNLQVLKF